MQELIVSIVVLIGIYYWYLTQVDKDVFLMALCYRVVAGLMLGVLYQKYGGDTWAYYHDADLLKVLAWEDLGSYLQVLIGKHIPPDSLYFVQQPRALYFVKGLSVIDIMVGSYWLCSVMLSLFSFGGLWSLSKTLIQDLDLPRWAVWISLLFLPSAVFWGSGVLKESVMLGTMAWVLYFFLKMYQARRLQVVGVLVLLISFVVLWRLKYYYAAGLYATLSALVLSLILSRSFRYKIVSYLLYVTILALMLVLATYIHPNLYLHHIIGSLHQNHHSMLSSSNPLSVIAFDFEPTVYSFLINLPKALWAGLYRPMIGEGHNIYYHYLSLENALLLLLLPCSLFCWNKMGRPFSLLAFSMTMYTLMMGALLGISSPNFGSLSRYKVGYIVCYVLLCLIPICAVLSKDKIPNSDSHTEG